MHPYLPYLLEDIHQAERAQSKIELERAQSLEEHFEEVEQWLANDPPHTFSYFCGLKSEDFPPAEQLSDADMEIICKAFKKMMFTWNLDIDLPKNLPLSIAYTMTVDTLNQKTSIVNMGTMTFDYCTGSPERCVFKAYFPCLNISFDLPENWDEGLEDEERPF